MGFYKQMAVRSSVSWAADAFNQTALKQMERMSEFKQGLSKVKLATVIEGDQKALFLNSYYTEV